MARDDFVQTIERWFDWKHDMREFLEIVRDFPGVLELLPWPGANGAATRRRRLFRRRGLADWFAKDQDPKKGRSLGAAAAGAAGSGARRRSPQLRAAELDPECTLYVAGRAPTPVAVRVVSGQVEIGWIDEGDGRVPWKTGIPPGVPVWYTDAVHGDLANHETGFRGLSRTDRDRRHAPARARAVRRRARGDPRRSSARAASTGNALYPSADEVLAAATGGARPGRRASAARSAPVIVEVIHGSLASADSPVLIGAYANDSLRGSAKFLDGHLGGRLERAFRLGRYPRPAGRRHGLPAIPRRTANPPAPSSSASARWANCCRAP